MSNGIIIRIDWNENKWEKPSGNIDFFLISSINCKIRKYANN